VAVVPTLVTNKNKYAQAKQYKNTVNTSTLITEDRLAGSPSYAVSNFGVVREQ